MRVTEVPLSSSLTSPLAPMPLQQSPGYGRALRRLGAAVRRVELSEGEQVRGQALLLRRGWGRLGVTVAIRGPVWQGAPDPALKAHLIGGMARGANPLVVQDGAGLRLGGSRTLAILSLTHPAAQRKALAPTWRNHLRRGEASGLEVEDLCPGPAELEAILTADRAQQAARRYAALPARFLHAWQVCNPRDLRLYRALMAGKVVASALFLLHRPWATYHIAISSDEARRTEAHRLILWRAMFDLHAAGYTTLDLGLAEAGTPGLADFKRGTGARLEATGPLALWLPARARQCGSPDASVPGPMRASGI